MYYSINLQTDRVKCTSTETQTVSCQVAYPALRTDEEVSAHFFCLWTVTNFFFFFCNNVEHYVISLQIKFRMNFDYSLDQLQKQTEVKFEAKRYT